VAAASKRSWPPCGTSRGPGAKGLAEEQPKAYKNVDDVVDAVHQAGLSKKKYADSRGSFAERTLQ
jgi:RNA-splicing ligase RtcB